MWCYFADDEVRSVLSQGEILDRVIQPNTVLLQPSFNARVKGLENVPMSDRADMFRQIHTQSQPLQPVCVDETDIELEHVGQEMIRDIPIQQQPDLLLRVVTILHFQHLNQSAEV